MKTILLPMSKENILAIMQDRKTMTRRMSKKYANVKKGDICEIQETLICRNGFVCYEADDLVTTETWKWKLNRLPSIFMPRRFVRIRCEAVANVRKELLQDIPEEDAEREGCHPEPGSTYYLGFKRLWDSINGKNHPWVLNEEVFVLSFKRIDL